jgi:cation-transporting ATPase 13A3/4/5
MADICVKSSFPSDYEEMLDYYTKHGYRVIAMAGKSIDGLSWLKAQRMRREQAESGLQFLGLIIFENKLKPGTTPAIQTLRAAHFACRMVTGDNPQTAVSVGRECGLVSQSAHVFSPVFLSGNAQIARSKLEWTSVDDSSLKLDPYSLKPLQPDLAGSDELPYQDYGLVVTGDVFRWMINHAPLETLQRMLVKAQIFARMSPDEKHELVERLQSLGYTVAFCGDGANDSAALAASDVGISLSEQEASLAAPFTSRTPDISCVIDVIKEGRAALVTSFSCFKYMALYSLIQFTTITLLYSFASSLGDFQFLYIDLFIIIPIAVTMGRTLPFEQLYPKGPTASLVSKKVLSSIIGQIIATSAVQFWVFFWARAQPWYEPPPKNTPVPDGKLEILNYENTTLFLVSCFQYILVAAVFSIGPPYRKPMWTNGLLMMSFVVLTALSILLLLAPPQSLISLLELMSLPTTAKLPLFAAVLVNVAVSSALERWAPIAICVAYVSRQWKMYSRSRRRDGNAYKVIERGLDG